MPKAQTHTFLAIGILSFIVGSMIFDPPGARAENPSAFYEGKTIHWVVSSGAGSPTDLLSRLAGQYLGEKIGAKVKVENMDRNKGLNYAFGQAKPDGLTLVSKASTAVLLNELAKAPGIKYKSAEFIHITDLMADMGALFAKPGSPYASIEALRQAKGLKAGGTSARGFLSTSAAVLFEIIGIDGKVIPGYKSPPTLMLALGQDEINVIAWQAAASLKKVKDGTVKPLCVLGKKRFPALPDVPTLEELGVKIPDTLADAYALIGKSGQAVMAPPGVPDDRVKFLRDAFMELGENKNMQKEIEKIVGYASPFEPGKEIQLEVNKIMSNRELGAQLKAIVDKYTAAR